MMANERIFLEYRAHEQRPAGHGMLRRRALVLIVAGLAFVAVGGANLDLFDVTVGCVAVAAGGAWRCFL